MSVPTDRLLRPLPRFVLIACGALALASCDDGSPTTPATEAACVGEPARPSLAPARSGSLEEAFAAAERESGVPAPLLKAIGYVETRLQMVESTPEHGRERVHGVMALREGEVARAAALAGVSPLEARTLPAANVRAAAALLRAWADETGIAPLGLGAWAPVVARYGAVSLAAARAAYVHDDVYGTLRRGFSHPAATLAPVEARPDFPLPSLSLSGMDAPDYRGARWYPSPNFNARPGGQRAAMVIVHTCEGGYTGCWSWLASPQSGVSAHYVVNESGSEITQLVHEADRAWHIGARYDCNLNAGHACERNGQQSNDFTIGIEHAGFASQGAWPESQIDASARLVCDLTRRQGIPRSRVTIVAHGQLQPQNRTDPGPNWPWAAYLEKINRYCGDAAPPAAAELVVDSDEAANDPRRARASFPAGWTATRQTPGHYGSGYYFASTARSAADPAVFHFYLAESGFHTVEAWWTQGSNRSPGAAFVVTAADGRRLARLLVNQQQGGARWNALGTFDFPAGWNRVEVSREGTPGCVVIADAVRVR